MSVFMSCAGVVGSCFATLSTSSLAKASEPLRREGRRAGAGEEDLRLLEVGDGLLGVDGVIERRHLLGQLLEALDGRAVADEAQVAALAHLAASAHRRADQRRLVFGRLVEDPDLVGRLLLVLRGSPPALRVYSKQSRYRVLLVAKGRQRFLIWNKSLGVGLSRTAQRGC